jgi:hypothetical protein
MLQIATTIRIIVLLACWNTMGLAWAQDGQEWNFITRRGDQLYDGDRLFRFISFNIPNLMVIEDAYDFTRPNPWRWPNEFEIEDALESIRQMGGQVVRTYVVSVYREGSDMGECVHVRGPGRFNEEGFRALDKVIEVARRKRIRLIIPFVDQAKWWGGVGEYAAFRGKPPQAFWTDRQVIDDFKATIRHLLSRKNVYTGIAYRDEPAILGWQTGNEIDSTSEWTREIAAYVKQLDPNHLVIEGKSLRGVPVWSLDDPNIDVITTHHYPWGEDHDYVRPIRAAHALTKGKKAYVVGEFGFVETPHLVNAINAVIEDGISGALLWSLRMHRREGGFYWHMEVGTGRNIYKAYHWPGFASGDRYDELQMLGLMREKAFEIRGLAPPALEPPGPPTLLPIRRVSEISWQGSAGAAAYDVWRADGEDGPWEKIATGVSDAEVQYRPLYDDDRAAPGDPYFYRIVARNGAGTSQPSNIVGPVVAECRTLVDECRDLTVAHSSTANVTNATENARTVQEDCHRLAMPPDSSVTYRVGAPISGCRVFSFARGEAALQLAVSRDGEHFESVDASREAYSANETVYGYLTPVLNTFKDHASAAQFLRISLPERPADNSGDEQAAAPVEISRVEIEYDRAANAVAGDGGTQAAAAPLSGAIFIDHPDNLREPLEWIDRAAQRGDRRLNVVVTILVDLTDDLRIKSFGRFGGPNGQYSPYNDSMHEELSAGLRRVFARMAEHGMEIFILPHIDAGGRVRQWRNWVDFDPLEPYGGYTYDGLMIGTIVEALEQSVPRDTHVEMALSGEMGSSLFRYPQSYRRIVQELRRRTELKQLKVGISLNHGGIAGRGNPTGAPDIRLSNEGRDELQSLIDECDFVGMSFYRPVRVSPTADDFVRGIEHFMGEFREYGLKVATTKPMHFSEVGIGGGSANGRRDRAPTPARAAQTPWGGTGDPRHNPWRDPALQALRRRYHDALLEFLARQPAPWRVSAAFFWSSGSWDPQGMRDAEFADPRIIESIQRHNAAIGD